MPEKLTDNIINNNILMDLITKTLGQPIQPNTDDPTDVGYFNYYNMANVVSLSEKLNRILVTPNMITSKDLQSYIALIGINLWNDIWMEIAYQDSNLSNNEYQRSMDAHYKQLEQFVQQLSKNEGITVSIKQPKIWENHSAELKSYIEDQKTNLFYDKKAQCTNMELMMWEINATNNQQDRYYRDQMVAIYHFLSDLVHKYDNPNQHTSNNNQKIQALKLRIKPMITELNQTHQHTMLLSAGALEKIQAINLRVY